MGVVAINRKWEEAEQIRVNDVKEKGANETLKRTAANGECKGIKPGEVSDGTVDDEDIFCVTDREGNVTPMDAGKFRDFVKMVARENRLRDRTDFSTLSSN